MDEKDYSPSDEENQKDANNSPKVDILAQVNLEDEEEEKSEGGNSEEDTTNQQNTSNPMASFLNIVNQANPIIKNVETIDTNSNIKKYGQKEDDNDLEDNSIEEELLLECQKEEEENLKIIKQKELDKTIRRVLYYNFKDYYMLFILFLSSSLNFNHLSLVYIIIGITYLFLTENLNEKPKKIKYFMEIFLIGYASYSLIFKIIVVILAKQDYDKVIDNKNLFINIGIAYLNDPDSFYFFIITFSTEIIMIPSSLYGFYVSFKGRILKDSDINFRKGKNITIRQLILISYIFIILFSVFNISFLTLFYTILIQVCFLLCSLKINEDKMKKIFKYVIYIILFFISLQLFLINIFNIPTFQDRLLGKYQIFDKQKKEVIKVYSELTQIGISYIYASRDFEEKTLLEYIKKKNGYFYGILSMLVLTFILGELNKGPDILSEEELKAKKIKERIERSKEINKNNYILVAIDEIVRVISIIWIYFFRNYFSIGIFFVVFFSFYFIERKKNRFLILYLLLPMLFLTLSFSHISNIDGLFENLEEDENKDKKLKLKRFSIEKYDYDNEYKSLYYLCGHLFYILLMFLISSLYSFPKVKEMIKNKQTILSEQKSQNIKEKADADNDENKQDNEAILPSGPGVSSKSVDIANSPKNNENEMLYEDVYEERNSITSEKNNSSSDSDSDDGHIKPEIPEDDLNNQKMEIVNEFNFRFKDLLGKLFFINIDKVTLVVMYLVSVNKINIIHLVLVIIFIMQIIIPKKMHYFYKIIISIFQLLFLAEFILDLLKVYIDDKLSTEQKDILKLFIVYSDKKDSNEIEIFIYGVVYCFCFQYRAYRNQYISSLLENKNISLRN